MERNVIMLLRRLAPCFAALLVAACGHSPTSELLTNFGHRTESWRSFGVCVGYGCSTYYHTGLNDQEQARVRAAFGPPAADAAAEREAIRRAVAEMELILGPKTGTAHDQPGAAIINFDRKGQMDCIDESFNTTAYLTLLAADGLLRLHDVGPPLRRGYFVNRWPHNTATVIERGSGQKFAIDSWFHGNGVPPEVVGAKEWLDGWSPAQGRPAVLPTVLSSGE